MYKIIIADDESEILNGLCNFFPWNSLGFQVVGKASNGREAYDLIKSGSVDVLLCDIVMPELTGLEIAKRIYKEKLSVYVVFLTAFASFEYAKEALSYGVRRYIQKAIHFDELVTTFSEIKEELDSERKTGDDIAESVPYNKGVISYVKNYIDNNYATATVLKVSQELHMNYDYICKLFKKYTGMTFSEYLAKVRMEQAARLLKDPRYSIYDISELVGYSNQFNFSRAFKHFYGKSPHEYRMSIMKL